MKLAIFITIIVFLLCGVALWACCKLSGDISKQEEKENAGN